MLCGTAAAVVAVVAVGGSRTAVGAGFGWAVGWVAGWTVVWGFLGLVGGRSWMSARAGEHQSKDHSLHVPG